MVFVRLVDTGRKDARDGGRSVGSEHDIRNHRARCRRRCAGADARAQTAERPAVFTRASVHRTARAWQWAGRVGSTHGIFVFSSREARDGLNHARHVPLRHTASQFGCAGAPSSGRKREASACTPPQMPPPCTRSSLTARATQNRPLASDSMFVCAAHNTPARTHARRTARKHRRLHALGHCKPSVRVATRHVQQREERHEVPCCAPHHDGRCAHCPEARGSSFLQQGALGLGYVHTSLKTRLCGRFTTGLLYVMVL